MSKHTPGQWIAQAHSRTHYVTTGDILIADVYPGGTDAAEDNARLIAAAPDLLTACQTARLQMIAFGNLMNWPFETPQAYADAINGLSDALEQAGIEVKR